MAGFAPTFISVAPRGSTSGEIDRTVVWLRGEHDVATKVSLVAAITGAVESDDADLLVDLSAVTFMDASTVGAIVTSRRLLRSRLLSLEVRAPSPTARRLLDLCGLVSLVHLSDAQATHPAGAADGV